MKKGDIITCANKDDLKRTMRDLSIAGFHAVKDTGENYNIRITGMPETEYLVEARSQNTGVQRAYCYTLEEAEDIAAEYGNSYQWVQILKGYPGEWETISQNW